MTDFVVDNTPVGRRILDRALSGRALHKLLKKRRVHPSSGEALWILAVLRHPDARRDYLRLARVSPESFRSDEDCARALAVSLMIGNLGRWCDAEFNKRLGPFSHERRKAQAIHELGQDYEPDARQHVYRALAHLEAAWSAITRDAVRYAGWYLEQEFSGLRAPLLVAELSNDAFEPRPKKTERQARYLCGWEQHRSKTDPAP
jgi:hypothetical protein